MKIYKRHWIVAIAFMIGVLVYFEFRDDLVVLLGIADHTLDAVAYILGVLAIIISAKLMEKLIGPTYTGPRPHMTPRKRILGLLILVLWIGYLSFRSVMASYLGIELRKLDGAMIIVALLLASWVQKNMPLEYFDPDNWK